MLAGSQYLEPIKKQTSFRIFYANKPNLTLAIKQYPLIILSLHKFNKN